MPARCRTGSSQGRAMSVVIPAGQAGSALSVVQFQKAPGRYQFSANGRTTTTHVWPAGWLSRKPAQVSQQGGIPLRPLGRNL